MFGKKVRQPAAQPKHDDESPVRVKLDELNRHQRERNRRSRMGERRSSVSMVVLDHRETELLRELIHEMGVTPVVGDDGLWTLFQ
jgi:hypothetical protein